MSGVGCNHIESFERVDATVRITGEIRDRGRYYKEGRVRGDIYIWNSITTVKIVNIYYEIGAKI